jgi:hypothetical protein
MAFTVTSHVVMDIMTPPTPSPLIVIEGGVEKLGKPGQRQ